MSRISRWYQTHHESCWTILIPSFTASSPTPSRSWNPKSTAHLLGPCHCHTDLDHHPVPCHDLPVPFHHPDVPLLEPCRSHPSAYYRPVLFHYLRPHHPNQWAGACRLHLTRRPKAWHCHQRADRQRVANRSRRNGTGLTGGWYWANRDHEGAGS